MADRDRFSGVATDSEAPRYGPSRVTSVTPLPRVGYETSSDGSVEAREGSAAAAAAGPLASWSRWQLRWLGRSRDKVTGRGQLHDVPHRLGPMLVVVASVIAWPVAVRAETVAISLAWNAPADCPSAVEVEREVLRLVAPRTRFSSPISATASTEFDARGHYVLKLETTQAGVEGERVFSGRTCRAVADAAIVTMALSLDPNIAIPKDYGTAGSDATSKEQFKESSATDSAVGAPIGSLTGASTDGIPAATSSARTPRGHSDVLLPTPTDGLAVAVIPSPPRRRIEGYLRSVVGWRWGSLPNSSGELGLTFGLRYARWSSQLTFAASPSIRSAYSHETPNAGGAFSMQAGELLTCWSFIAQHWSASPCVGLALTHLTARGLGVKPIRDGQLYWTAPELALQGSYRASPSIALYVGISGFAPLRRPGAYLGESDRIFRPEAVIYQLAGGGEVRIW